MSSAILYLAIVAIWACVLIPRWLRRGSFSAGGQEHHAAHADVDPTSEDEGRARATRGEMDGPEAVERANSLARSSYEGPGRPAEGRGRPPVSREPVPADRGAGPAGREPVPAGREPVSAGREPVSAGRERPFASRTAAGHGIAEPHHATDAHEPGLPPARPPRDDTRQRIVAARRRLLGMLLALVVAAASLAWLRLAAWWVIVPPTIMLGGYLLMLREAAHADAEHDRRQIAAARAASRARTQAQARARAQAGAGRRNDAPRPGTPPDADVIHIPGRPDEEFYDQYADAKLRAVGD